MKQLRTIILAAGKGTRMKSATPKVLHHVCGKPIIEYVMGVAKAAGAVKTYIVLGHEKQKIQECLNENICVVTQNKLLGTADAVKSAVRFLKTYKGDILIMCGDTPLIRPETVKNLIRRHRKTGAACTFLTAVVQDNEGYGRVIRGDNGAVAAIREERDAAGYEKNIVEVNAGVYGFKSDALFKMLKLITMNKKKKEFYLTDGIALLAENGRRIETVETEEPLEALGINTREDLALAEATMRQRILKNFMLNGVTIIDPKTTYIGINVQIGRDTIIHPFTVIEQNVKIGSQCLIGPFAHFRPGTKIANNVQVGNFAEVSRTQIGRNSLMKHFGFLGDARVGDHVNIGAGVVTANFDGKNKNKTYIQNHAFIGSDSILVAPVQIGKKVVTGAGCVVTKGNKIPDGRVVVGVPGKILDRKKIKDKRR